MSDLKPGDKVIYFRANFKRHAVFTRFNAVVLNIKKRIKIQLESGETKSVERESLEKVRVE